MNKERFMKDFNGEKIFSLEYDKETLKDMVIEKQEEIKDLKKQIELLVKDDESSQQTIINQKQEIERLNKALLDIKELVVNNACLDDSINKCADDLIYYKCDELLDIVNKALGSNKENV